jgi:hypothetical protein
MSLCHACNQTGCRTRMSRRTLLSQAVALAAAPAEAFSQALATTPHQTRPAGKPRIDVFLVRPAETPVVSWPGGNCDVPAQQALFTKTLEAAAKKLDVDLRLQAKPVDGSAEVGACLERLRQSPPDGLLLVAMELQRWQHVNQFVESRGDIPTLIYSNLSGFTQHMQPVRDNAKTFLAATQDVAWLEQGLRLLSAVWQIKNTRLLWIGDKPLKETNVPLWGTTFHRVTKTQFQEEFQRTTATPEVRAMADAYAKAAKKIVEPAPPDLVESAKNYVVIRRMMESEKCHGVTIDCLGWKNPVCVAYSRLMDEGCVAACESDVKAAVAQLIVSLVARRPSFIQDPSPNTVNNTLIGAHCTSPTRLKGYDNPWRAPFLLRNYHTRTGVSPQVLWPEGDDATVVDFDDWTTLMFSSGKVVSNIAQPPAGCCRTAVEVSLNNVSNTLNTKGFHQLFVWGNIERQLQAFGKLAGAQTGPIA